MLKLKKISFLLNCQAEYPLNVEKFNESHIVSDLLILLSKLRPTGLYDERAGLVAFAVVRALFYTVKAHNLYQKVLFITGVYR